MENFTSVHFREINYSLLNLTQLVVLTHISTVKTVYSKKKCFAKCYITFDKELKLSMITAACNWRNVNFSERKAIIKWFFPELSAVKLQLEIIVLFISVNGHCVLAGVFQV